MTAYYNEIDPFAAEWLRNLINAGHIAPGDVDERSVEDVKPQDLKNYTQCHFFAGVGVWSYALRRASCPDDRQVWTGSCPCQPFSAAGKGLGFDDERHLWPAWYWLIGECRPPVIFGEQVASSAVDPWIDLVHADMEALGYPFGCVPFPSAGVGAPHIRDRLYWTAYAPSEPTSSTGQTRRSSAEAGGAVGGVELTSGQRRQRREAPTPGYVNDRPTPKRTQGQHGVGVSGAHRLSEDTTGPTNGLWKAADWLLCRDDEWRPVEPGTFPLVDGASARVGRLRAYGNAINAEAATEFITVAMQCQP